MSVSEAPFTMVDGNAGHGLVAYALNEVIAIYPITPSSNMGEWADQWASEKRPNLWGTIPSVVEMQSEGGAAGAVHGALQTGSLATTFTASQGLLLMIPNMFKIAGELTPAVFHIAARTLATHALSIFGDHSDVMACRSAGWAMLCSASVQEAQDFACIAQAATLAARIPFLHFFDGFRTSHEIAKIVELTEAEMRSMIDLELVFDHRARALTPDRPVVRGTAQNPDVFFQARERANPFYAECANIVVESMNRFARITGRRYAPFEYYGAPDAERVIVLMGSGCEAAHEAVDALTAAGEKIGIVKVRLYRPFDNERFIAALPESVTSIAVLDRTKESGAAGEPLFLDVVNALYESPLRPRVVGGRYGLSSKEFTPAMVKGVFDTIANPHARGPFTVGINDDVTHLSIPYDPFFTTETDDVIRAVFYGLGSDGTVSANKNSCKIIGDTSRFVQGYFVYDSKKAGTVTVSHLRFGPRPIRSTYLIDRANFIACHQPQFIERVDMVKDLAPGGTFLLNAPSDVKFPPKFLSAIEERGAKLYVIDATKVARECGLGNRISTIMQVAFFATTNVLPIEAALDAVRDAVRKTFKRKGQKIVDQNLHTIDATIENLRSVILTPSEARGKDLLGDDVATRTRAPEFVNDVLFEIIAGRGDQLPVSAMPCDGTFPSGTTKYEKRNLAQEIPVWDVSGCIQCGKCAMVCPHAAIRIKAYDESALQAAPATFKTLQPIHKDWKGLGYTIQVAPEDCTGCAICVDVCPAKSKAEPTRRTLYMAPQPPLRDEEAKNWDFFLGIPEFDRGKIQPGLIRSIQLAQPLFEFSGACSGCGETPYLKLMTQLFGDRVVVANATGCSSIYGGNLPTTPWTTNADGRGPAWANSLFEDNAEFGLGFRLSLDKQREFAAELLRRVAEQVGEDLVTEILASDQKDEAEIAEQRK
ncbi:MAG TPA: pyruvate:ferredoxin (flavodoxin) oxidoreductase, partial [Thermoanaerobaculia bacterium]|nr:pyruvate:ferredoxin (flavodoxin) oxidoreductase [Thermoanaerobaculia bacterium]